MISATVIRAKILEQRLSTCSFIIKIDRPEKFSQQNSVYKRNKTKKSVNSPKRQIVNFDVKKAFERKTILQLNYQAKCIPTMLSSIAWSYVLDKYVIIGSHIDGWMQGAVDSGTGYTVLQELARTFAYHIDKGKYVETA